MLRNFTSAFAQALESIRSNFFHTFLSILGIVIGVAALVSILSLIDGMEKFANDQISSTTDLESIQVQTETNRRVNQVNITKDTFPALMYEQLPDLQALLQDQASAVLAHRSTGEITLQGQNEFYGAWLIGIAPQLPEFPKPEIEFGRTFNAAEVAAKAPVAVLNFQLAKSIVGDQSNQTLVGKTIQVKDQTLKIIGILKENKLPMAQLYMPLTLVPASEMRADPAVAMIHANSVELVPVLKKKVEDWLQQKYGKLAKDFSVSTNEFRVDQVAKGFLLFRVVMGFIVGISILVGGIGVMNVLLISVTERTSEIGIRKAMGANKSDILRLFLSESITVSLLGSMLGLILGVLFTMAAIPIIKAFVDVPFQAAYTWNTFLIITTIAILIGVIFGTYPAMKAARLDPVEAIRRE
ncbi:MAG: ABC transporter permease [Saprospiraceae bacterium]